MNKPFCQKEFDACCWNHIKDYFKALDKEHIVRATEHAVKLYYEDTKEP